MYLVVTLGYWGKGRTLTEAYNKCGGSREKNACHIVYMTSANDDSLRFDGQGGAEWSEHTHCSKVIVQNGVVAHMDEFPATPL